MIHKEVLNKQVIFKFVMLTITSSGTKRIVTNTPAAVHIR